MCSSIRHAIFTCCFFEKQSASISYVVVLIFSFCKQKSTSSASLSSQCSIALLLFCSQLGRLSVTEAHTKVQIGTQKNGRLWKCKMADCLYPINIII